MSKKRKRRKMRQETIVFDEKKLAQVIPGMLKSADELFKFGNTIKDNDTLSVLYFGNTVIYDYDYCTMFRVITKIQIATGRKKNRENPRIIQTVQTIK